MNRDFNDIYEKIKTSNIEEMNKISKKRKYAFIALIIFAILMFIFKDIVLYNDITIIIFLLISVLGVLINIKINREYKRIFKENIIKKIVNLYNKELVYNPKLGISKTEYIQSNLDKEFEKFNSEDLIMGKLFDKYLLKISQIKTTKEEIQTDDNGKITSKEDVTVFEGMYGIIDLENKNLEQIDIVSNTFISKYNSKRIEIDSAEFEKTYDIFSNDKIYAMQIFTPEVIDEINKFKEITGYTIQIRINKDKIFFRVRCGEYFKAPLFKKIMDYNVLNKYFKMIDTPINLIGKILESIEEIR